MNMRLIRGLFAAVCSSGTDFTSRHAHARCPCFCTSSVRWTKERVEQSREKRRREHKEDKGMRERKRMLKRLSGERSCIYIEVKIWFRSGHPNRSQQRRQNIRHSPSFRASLCKDLLLVCLLASLALKLFCPLRVQCPLVFSLFCSALRESVGNNGKRERERGGKEGQAEEGKEERQRNKLFFQFKSYFCKKKRRRKVSPGYLQLPWKLHPWLMQTGLTLCKLRTD